LATYLYQIGFFYSRSSFGEFVCQFAVVGHQKQSLAHVIQAPNRVKPLAHLLEELHHCRSAFRILHRGHEALGFIEYEIAKPFRALQQLAVHANVVASGIGLGAQRGHDLAVDLDAPLLDQFLASASARNSRLSQNLLEPLQLRRRPRLGIGLRFLI
jgi:hypothetical protein